ncbi:hypothetical protein AB0L74_30735 [Streptomyces sp. NPDC052020]|uniref:hypothetical protein n=1 Tax=Streptomyces sp. NPDC052020 TaxID=3155677 RepID=UPI0034125839
MARIRFCASRGARLPRRASARRRYYDDVCRAQAYPGRPPGRPRCPHRPAPAARRPPPADPPAGPAVAALRAVADDLAASTHAIGEPLNHGLAARRSAMSGGPPRPARDRPVTAVARPLL